MAVSLPRPPPSLDELRARSHDALAHLRPTDFAVRAWSRAAQTAFDHADKAWREGRATNDPVKVAEAFLDYKRAAGILQIIVKHPQYKEVVQAKSDDYYAVSRLKEMVMGAKASQDQVIAWLERREREAGPEAKSSSAAGLSMPEHTNGTRTDASTSRPAPHKPPSFPTASLADRMAKLRASGLSVATAANPQLSPPPSPKRPSSPTRSPRQTAKPLSPTASSPRAPRTGDDVADNAGERSGSAPPVLPFSNVQEPATVWEDSALQFRREGGAPIASRQKGVVDRGPAGGVGLAPDRGEPPSPSANFATAFPSLDDFERGIGSSAVTSEPRSATSSSYSFPSVPSFDLATASSRPVRPPPPHPPKPPHLDERTFIREQKERADAMANLAAGQSGSSVPSSSTTRTSLPAALVPGSGKAVASASSASSSRRPSAPTPLPPPTSSSKSFKIPFAADVRPAELWQYLQTSKAETGDGPRVLLLDLRTREEYEYGRVKAETVCLEPIILRDGIRSSDIEDALSLSPPHEAALFAARQYYDLVVVYDRSSSSLPSTQPTSTSSDAQRVLWNLVNAIYEREFVKHLRRQPLLLVGGWEAWERKVGAQGIVGTSLPPKEEEPDRADAKRAHRRAAVLPLNGDAGSSVVRKGSGDRPAGEDYFPSSGYAPTGPPSSSNSVAGLVSPRLAMPPVAAQRSGPAPAYDPFAVSPLARPSYAQPQADQYAHSTSSTSSPAMPRARSGTLDIYGAPQPPAASYANGSDYSRPSYDYTRPSIDYPQLQHRAPPTVNHPTRPPPPPPPGAFSPVPSLPLARPPPIKPAPMRSNSSFSSMQPAQYSSAHSRFPTGLLSFDEGVIGITGLKNLGNTCYMNSTIQCLSAAVPFARYFTGGTYRKDINVYNPLGTKGALANAVAELIRALWAQQYHFLAPVTFRENICRVAPQFRGSEQHDAQEFLGFLLDGLHEDCNYVVKKPPPIEMTPEREHDLETLPPQVMSDREWQIYKMRNDSFIVQCFQGQFRNQLRCLTCQKTSTTYNTFMPLSVPIPGGRGVGKVSLVACLEQFVRDEVLDGDDAWHCPRCKKNRKAVKKLSLSKLPPILVIHLKRFSFHGPFSDKIETQVQYPLAGLDLTHFVPPPIMSQQGPSASPPKGYVYDLFGVTNHYGNLSSGHYTAFVRSGRDWFNIGDSKVTPADPANVQSAKSAYILYYTLRT
ncbi:hypothetical protein JCM3770_005037 [Rhodotorula araucariae]